jgi:hypothetical protein
LLVMAQWPVIVQSPTLIFEDEDEEEYEDDFEGRSYGFNELNTKILDRFTGGFW